VICESGILKGTCEAPLSQHPAEVWTSATGLGFPSKSSGGQNGQKPLMFPGDKAKSRSSSGDRVIKIAILLNRGVRVDHKAWTG
jgi:hypothetical protein